MENKNSRYLDKAFITNEQNDYDTVNDTVTSSLDDVVVSAHVMVSTTVMLKSNVKEKQELNRRSNSSNATTTTSSDKLLILPEVAISKYLTSEIEKTKDPKLLSLETKQKLDETIPDLEYITKERKDRSSSYKIDTLLMESSNKRNSTHDKKKGVLNENPRRRIGGRRRW